MPLRGPKGSSRELKLLKGEKHKDRLAKDKIKPSIQSFRMPSWLSPGAKAEWQRLAPEMKRLGLLTALDVAMFSCLCEAYSIFVELVKDINENDMTYKTQKGFTRARPQLDMMFKAMRELMTLCQQFGMTPVSRGRIDIKVEKKVNEDFDW